MLSALSENQQTISCIYLVPSEIQIQVVCMTIALLCMYTTILFVKNLKRIIQS